MKSLKDILLQDFDLFEKDILLYFNFEKQKLKENVPYLN